MKISRVLNNSCVVVLDDNQKELILMGNGIGYAKRADDMVDKEKIDKVFVMQDQRKQNCFEELLARVPDQIVDLSEELIEGAAETLGAALDESIHIALPDHIARAIDNYRENIVLRNTLLLEIQKFYGKEYEIGLRGLKLIREKTGCLLAEDEAGFIAMHFINAQSNSESNQTKAMITLVEEMDQMISSCFGAQMADLDRSSLVYIRYMTHLKFFAQRILEKTYFEAQDEDDLNLVMKRYKKEYDCSRKVCEYIREKYDYEVDQDEILYLTVHLVQIMRKRS